MKYYEFSYKEQHWTRPIEGGVKCQSIASWFFDKAPYGSRIVNYKEISEEEFKKLPDYSDGKLFY